MSLSLSNLMESVKLEQSVPNMDTDSKQHEPNEFPLPGRLCADMVALIMESLPAEDRIGMNITDDCKLISEPVDIWEDNIHAINKCESIVVVNDILQDLYLPNLKHLEYYGGIDIDLILMPNLESLDVEYTCKPIKVWNLSTHPNLLSLIIRHSDPRPIVLPPQLQSLQIGDAPVDLSHLHDLRRLTFGTFCTRRVDFSHNLKLEYLNIGNKYNLPVKLYGLTNLVEFRMSHRYNCSIDLRDQANLKKLYVNRHFYDILNLSPLKSLEELYLGTLDFVEPLDARDNRHLRKISAPRSGIAIQPRQHILVSANHQIECKIPGLLVTSRN